MGIGWRIVISRPAGNTMAGYTGIRRIRADLSRGVRREAKPGATDEENPPF